MDTLDVAISTSASQKGSLKGRQDAHNLARASLACDASGQPQGGNLHAPRSLPQVPEPSAPPACSRLALAYLNGYTAYTMEKILLER